VQTPAGGQDDLITLVYFYKSLLSLQNHNFLKINTTRFLIIWLFISTYSCKMANQSQFQEEENWKLGWRMIENSWNENYRLAELQFDSLLLKDTPMTETFLINGLDVKLELSKKEEALEIIANQSAEFINKLCERDFARELKPCAAFPEEKVENEGLRLELIKLYVDDQACRGNVMKHIIQKYQIDSTEVKTEQAWSTDEFNRNRLKEIFAKYGFPTRSMVGKEAMNGVFLIIQHADGDKEWQKSQLSNIETAAKNGDLRLQDFAYLFDRIKVNSGQPQRYGSQFLKVDRKNQIAQLRDTEDLANLNKRRREMGMMPIEMYRRLMLSI